MIQAFHGTHLGNVLGPNLRGSSHQHLLLQHEWVCCCNTNEAKMIYSCACSGSIEPELATAVLAVKHAFAFLPPIVPLAGELTCWTAGSARMCGQPRAVLCCIILCWAAMLCAVLCCNFLQCTLLALQWSCSLLGQMPHSYASGIEKLQEDLSLQQQWFVNGQNYSRTLDAWLQRVNSQKAAIMHILQVNCCLQALRHFKCSVFYQFQAIYTRGLKAQQS